MDIFGIEEIGKIIIENRHKREVLRDEVFSVVINSQEYLFKLLEKKNTKEYWDWRLDFDKKRYGIKLSNPN